MMPRSAAAQGRHACVEERRLTGVKEE